ncbi:MAG: hypothetical protein FJ011_15330 [Chloroflexi bacterium]|nr:hypothetical protein [Chloroflexota bacterium]
MSWQVYPLAFRLLSPLHIGYRKVGNLQQTRGYVTGRALWAAVTSRVTRDALPAASGADYQRIGQKVNQQFRFTYLFPALNADGPAHHPWADEATFAYRFLDSYASTALDYGQQSAAEGLLHEVEFISPRARPLDGEAPSQVFLLGRLYVRDELDDELAGWQTALARLQLGGERGYGWGRLALAAALATPEQMELPAPLVQVQRGQPITAHALAAHAADRRAVSDVRGPVEPLVGWERNNRGAGGNWRLSEALICYAPGSIVAADATFAIGPDGVWHAAAA